MIRHVYDYGQSTVKNIRCRRVELEQNRHSKKNFETTVKAMINVLMRLFENVPNNQRPLPEPIIPLFQESDEDPITRQKIRTMRSVYDASGLKTVRYTLTPELYERLQKRDKALIRLAQETAKTFNVRVIFMYRDKETFSIKPR